MPAGDYLINVIDRRVRKILAERDRKLQTAVSGGGYSVPVTSGGVVVHGHNSASHTGAGPDDHHDEAHEVAAGGPHDASFPGDPTLFLDGEGSWSAPSPADTDQVWMPLTTVVAGDPELVWDDDDSLVPTLVPL